MENSNEKEKNEAREKAKNEKEIRHSLANERTYEMIQNVKKINKK